MNNSDYFNGSPQFQRTHRAIGHALITLLKVKPFEKITVQDILDATPVTRATFYKHFQDKYEIVELMQEECLRIQTEAKNSIFSTSFKKRLKLIETLSSQNREFMSALLKVHTEKVDLKEALVKRGEEEYLESFQEIGPSKRNLLAAKIYGQNYMTLHLAPILDPDMDLSPEMIYGAYLDAFLHATRLSDDGEIWELVHRKLKERE